MSQTQTVPVSAAKPAAGTSADWKLYEGHIPPILLWMCRGKEVDSAMLHKAMSDAKNFLPSESKIPEAEVNRPWREVLVCGWGTGTPQNRIMILIPFRDRSMMGIEVRTKGDVTTTNVHVALRALGYGLARVACDAMDAK